MTNAKTQPSEQRQKTSGKTQRTSKDVSTQHNQQLTKSSQADMFVESVVADVKKDFANRQQARRPYELAWQLNMNFVMGNQYCSISGRGDIEQEGRYYFWQEKQVYNHIAPIVETRISRLVQIRPRPLVRPLANSDKDNYSAQLATKILDSTRERLQLDNAIGKATMWSEICGTSFYKLGWNSTSLDYQGKQIPLGDVTVTVCPPFEIYPDSNVASDIEDCMSIIHARAYHTADIKRIWGVDIVGEKVQVFAIDNANTVGGLGYNTTVPSITQETKNSHAMVIERYTKPSTDYPQGLLEIVAGDKLLYRGDLPYCVGVDNSRTLPFIRQTAFAQVGCFWGSSVVERCIPVQRAYNAVKNRKHEFLNRLAMGILTIEDGSVDTDNLEEEGLSPGKVLVYRQGSNKPSMMDNGNVPVDFAYEEERLLKEFIAVSGVSEFASNSYTPTNVTSGIALQQIVDQDNIRMSITSDSIRSCIKTMSKMILRLYRQLATVKRMLRVCDDGGKVELYYYNNSDITSDDIVFETESILTDSLSNRRNMIFQLLSTGLLSDDNGNIPSINKSKILSMIGFGNWEQTQDTATLHINRADSENIDIDNAEILPIDDHKVHIEQHIRYVISGQAKLLGDSYQDKVLQHIAMHRQLEEDNGQQVQ